ncbi:MAG: glycosyltransferase [Acidobacteriaceae bacterium]|jgi:succinoglycan biosynthesis protein ExoM|nr:glycosyltransferase [Acidobacteriaceae bacterium]
MIPHISICVCTYKRPALLERCLLSIASQRTENRFTYSVVVADNDDAESARETVARVAAGWPVTIEYCAEPQQNIARTRNRAVRQASGDYVAFLDDDEFTHPDWLVMLYRTLEEYRADAVLGPVHPYFEPTTPRWVIEGGFYDRPVLATGTRLAWLKCRTGNVLLRREVFGEEAEPFDPACLSGEDQEFFRRKSEAGYAFVWCHEAGAREAVPPSRWRRGFLVRRALFRGIFAQRNHGLQPWRLVQALISTPLYALLLPVALPLGQARFMRCVFKLSYHAGRLLGFLGVNPIRQAYVVD